jgi:MFS family permease
VLIGALTSVGFSAFNNFTSPYLRDTGAPVIWVGLFHSLTAAVGIAGSLLGGVISDGWGRRPGIFLGRAARLVGWLGLLLLPSPLRLWVGACVGGLGMIAFAANSAAIAGSATLERRATAYALTGAVEGLAGIAVPIMIGLIADAASLRTALLFVLLPYGMTLILVPRLAETRHPLPPGADRPSPLAGARYMLSGDGRGAALMAAIWLVTGFEFGMMRPVWGLYLQDRFGSSYGGIGAVTTATAAALVVGQIIGGRFADHIGHSRLMIISLVSASLVWVTVPWAGSPINFTLYTSGAYMLGCLAAPCWGAVGASAAPRAVRGSVSGLYSALSSVGAVLGSTAGALIYTRGITLPFYGNAACEALMACMVLMGLRAGWRGFKHGEVAED